MGIHGLTKLLSDEAPGSIKEQDLKNLTGRKIAIDASMVMYQFLVAVRSDNGYASSMLMNEAGEVTSHIQGMFNRTIKLLAAGVKPVYVFDGKPPDLKGGELAKRLARRQQAEADLATAKESGEQGDVDKFSRRLVKVTKQHNDDCKELLQLMGVPVLTAPCEAEAQCAELARKGKVFATATEDMDALTFRTPKLLRKLTMSGTGNNKQPILEIDLEVALSGLGLSYEQFVDLCILCGCDYCSSIKGIGPKTALKMIKQYGTLEGIISAVKREKKYQLPKDWTRYRVRKNAVPPAGDEPSDTERKDEVGNAAADSTDEVATSGRNGENAINSGSEKAEPEQSDCKNEVLDDGDSMNEVLDDGDSKSEVLDDGDSINEVLDGDGKSEGATGDELQEDEEEEEGVEYEWVEPQYIRARELFLAHEVESADSVELKWTQPQEDALRTFLVEKMGFNAERVENGIKKLVEAQAKKAQQRMDSFFKPMVQTGAAAAAGLKRKAAGSAGSKPTKAGRGGGFRKR